jgi:hypothetical protein
MLGIGIGVSRKTNVVGTSISPSDISGLDLWLKFNTGISGASNTTAAGNMSDDEVIHSWTDQAGNYNAVQTTDAYRPNWESDTDDISFNGDNDHFDLAGGGVDILANEDFTVMVRHKFTNFSSSYALVGTAGGEVIKVNNSTDIVAKLNDGTVAAVWSETGGRDLATGVYYIFTLVRSGGSDGDLKMYVHGTGDDTNSTHSDKSWDDAHDYQDNDTFDIANIGASSDLSLNPIGFMRDVIVWNGTALSKTQREGMYDYINAQT